VPARALRAAVVLRARLGVRQRGVCRLDLPEPVRGVRLSDASGLSRQRQRPHAQCSQGARAALLTSGWNFSASLRYALFSALAAGAPAQGQRQRRRLAVRFAARGVPLGAAYPPRRSVPRTVGIALHAEHLVIVFSSARSGHKAHGAPAGSAPRRGGAPRGACALQRRARRAQLLPRGRRARRARARRRRVAACSARAPWCCSHPWRGESLRRVHPAQQRNAADSTRCHSGAEGARLVGPYRRKNKKARSSLHARGGTPLLAAPWAQRERPRPRAGSPSSLPLITWRAAAFVPVHSALCLTPPLLRSQIIARAYVFLYRVGRELTQRLLPPGRAPLLPGVRPGLIEGSFVDLSDAQWRSFREALPLLCVVAAASSAAARLVRASLLVGGVRFCKSSLTWRCRRRTRCVRALTWRFTRLLAWRTSVRTQLGARALLRCVR
jgi:hypothetical protein